MSEIFELEEILEDGENAFNVLGQKKHFSINDDNVADWALRKIAEENAELERLTSLAKQQIEDLQLKIKHLEEVAGKKTSFLKGCLAEYFQTVPHKSTKTQESYKLISGSLVFKLPKQNMVKDDAQLLEHFRQNGLQEYIKTKEEPAWGEYKKNLSIVDGKVIDTTTGEIVDVVKVEEVPGIFDVKTT